MIGNETTTDSLGYLTIDDNNNCSISHIMSRISPTLDMG
jgi:hypothetical protein